MLKLYSVALPVLLWLLFCVQSESCGEGLLQLLIQLCSVFPPSRPVSLIQNNPVIIIQGGISLVMNSFLWRNLLLMPFLQVKATASQNACAHCWLGTLNLYMHCHGNHATTVQHQDALAISVFASYSTGTSVAEKVNILKPGSTQLTFFLECGSSNTDM